jgi:tetratricopeptide (TPR) repeat protein
VQGIEEVYRATSRFSEWNALVDVVEPLVSQEDGPRPDWKTEWAFVQEYRQRLAIDVPGTGDAAAISAALAAHHAEATKALMDRKGPLTESERNALRSRVVAVAEQGLERMQRNDSKCLQFFEEAIQLAVALGDVEGELRARVNMGLAYSMVDAIRDFSWAEEVILMALDEFRGKAADKDPTYAALTLAEVLVRRLQTDARAGVPDAALNVILGRANQALGFTKECLARSGTRQDWARYHHALGDVFSMVGAFKEAVQEYQRAITFFGEESVHTARARYLIAYCLDKVGKADDAESYRNEARQIAERLGLVLEEKR